MRTELGCKGKARKGSSLHQTAVDNAGADNLEEKNSPTWNFLPWGAVCSLGPEGGAFVLAVLPWWARTKLELNLQPGASLSLSPSDSSRQWHRVHLSQSGLSTNTATAFPPVTRTQAEDWTNPSFTTPKHSFNHLKPRWHYAAKSLTFNAVHATTNKKDSRHGVAFRQC